jgi:hypothetical protein
MADRDIEQMRKEVIKRSALFTSVFIVLTVCFIFNIDDRIVNGDIQFNNIRNEIFFNNELTSRSIFSVVSLSVMFSYILFSGNYSRLLVSPIIIIGILTALHIHTGGQLARKILQLPKDQIEEILASHPSDLKVQIIRRFFS